MRALATTVILTSLLAAQDASRPTGPAPEALAQTYDREISALLSDRGLRRGGVPSEADAIAALDRLGAATPPGLESRARDLRVVARAYLDRRGQGGELVALVDAFRTSHGWDGKQPIDKQKADPRTLLLVAIDARLSQVLPPGELRAHPAAYAFPGAISDDARRCAAEVAIDTSIPRWHSTGLWAPAGEVVTVEVPQLPAGAVLTVIVGAHTDSVAGRPKWSRFPQVSRRFTIAAAGSHVVGSAFGGLLYVACERTDAGTIEMEFHGAVEAPRFVLGVTPLDEWKASIGRRATPFGELECDRIVWTLPTDVLARCEDPAEVLRFWSRVIDVQDELAGAVRTSPERFVLDRQISVGYMHSGYPLMGPVSAADAAIDLATLREKGNWGMFHEIGHNHQTVHYGGYANPWTFDDNVEVTVNVFSSWTYVAALERPDAMGHQHWRTDILAESLAKEFTSKPYPEKSHRERCLLWVHLIEEFGWDQVKAVFASYAAMPKEARPRGDAAKRSLFLEVWSRQVGRNLAPLFDAWGLAVTPEARAAVADLAPFTPRVPLPTR